MMQKIVRVRVNEPIHELDEYTETWNVVRVVRDEQDGWLHVLLERDEEASEYKLSRHNEYLDVVSRIDFGRTA